MKAIKTIRILKRISVGDAKDIQRKQIYEYSQFMILVSVGITIFAYSLSTQAASIPAITARYLVCLLVSVPVVLWQLWPQGSSILNISLRGLSRSIALSKVCIMILIFCVLVGGVFETFADVPAAQQSAYQQAALVHYLERAGATRIYSEYWTCNRLIFLSEEKIICGVLNEDLSLGENRYPPYLKIVQKVARPAYVFPLQSTYDLKFMQEHKKDQSLQKYRHSEYDGYSIYTS